MIQDFMLEAVRGWFPVLAGRSYRLPVLSDGLSTSLAATYEPIKAAGALRAMGERPNILEILKNESGPAADYALLTALREVGAATAQAIVDLLLLRKQKAGLCGLIELFHELDEPICRTIVEHVDELFPALRLAAQSKDDQVRLNVLEIISRGYAYRAAYLVDTAMHDRVARVREAAADTLYALADQLLKTSPIPDLHHDKLDPARARGLNVDLEDYMEDRRQVIGAIEGSLASYNIHLQPKVIETAMWFVDELDQKFWSIVGVPGSRAAHAAISVIVGVKSPRLVPFCITGLHYSTFRAPLSKVLGLCTDMAFIEEWIRQSWRLGEPKIHRAMASIKELAVLKRKAVELMQLPPALMRHLPRWIMATGLPEQVKLDFLKNLYRRGDEQMRRSTVKSMLPCAGERVISLLKAISRDNDERTAAVARFELAHRFPLEYPPSDLLEPPKAAAAPSSQVWGRPGSDLTFEKYWDIYDTEPDPQRREIGLRVFDGDASAVRLLARQMNAAEPSDRLKALRIATLLGLGEKFVQQIYRLSHDPNPEVRSAAVSALGRLPGPVSQHLLRTALQDSDARVQANAVEAIEHKGGEQITEDLLPKLASPDNRVRANAVKALLKLGVREAAITLLRMLDDPNRAQRISALWLIENMGLFILASRVMKLAQADQDNLVRSRARKLTGQITGQLPVGAAQ